VFRSFIAWLDSYISREDASSVLKALVGLMAFAGLLGTVFGNQAIRAGAFVVVLVFVASTTLLLLADRRHLRRESAMHLDLLTRYCDFIVDHHTKPLVRVDDWKEVVYIQPNGDVRETLTIRAIALRKEIYFIKLKAGSGWNQPEKYLRKVRVVARSMAVNGIVGPKWNVSRAWLSNRYMVYILHLHEPIHCGEEVRFEVARTWPAKCQPLMRLHTAESFTCRINGLLDVQRMEYQVVLPHETEAIYEPLGFTGSDPQNSIVVSRDDEGRQVFTWHSLNIPTYRTLGMRIELK
jgi:hypothetical protein